METGLWFLTKTIKKTVWLSGLTSLLLQGKVEVHLLVNKFNGVLNLLTVFCGECYHKRSYQEVLT